MSRLKEVPEDQLRADAGPEDQLRADAGLKRRRPLFEIHNPSANKQAQLFAPSSVLYKSKPRLDIFSWKTTQ